jgi:hypothetical protein
MKVFLQEEIGARMLSLVATVRQVRQPVVSACSGFHTIGQVLSTPSKALLAIKGISDTKLEKVRATLLCKFALRQAAVTLCRFWKQHVV